MQMSTKRDKPRAIILITLDACRADHVGCYGYPLATTPMLDRLAIEAVRFIYTFSPIGLTAPSHTSLLTGKYPRFHSIWFHNGDKILNKEQEVTLPLILKNLNYETAAFVSIMALQQKLSGLNLGFDVYDDTMPQSFESDSEPQLKRDADRTNEAVLSWINTHYERPFFLWIHYSEPHGPYKPPSPYDTEFIDNRLYGPPLSLNIVKDLEEGGIPTYQLLRPIHGPDDVSLDYVRDYSYYVSQYDGNLRFVDEHLKVLIQRLHELGLYDSALLIITADHGEALGENNIYFHHSLTVSLDQIRVPLFIKAPSWMDVKPGPIAEPVTTIDIMPTVLAFCGVEAQYLGLQGLNLVPLVKDESDLSWPERHIFSEIPSQLSVVDRSFQLLFDKGKESAQNAYPPYVKAVEGTKLFDYTTDPKGEKDVSANNIDVVKKLLAVVEKYRMMPEPGYSEVVNEELSKEEKADLKQRLSQLGYLPASEQESLTQEELLEKLRQVEAQLKDIYSSYSWRLMAPLRKIAGLFIMCIAFISQAVNFFRPTGR